MITLNGVEYRIKFTRKPEPVTYYVKGKIRQTNRMATYCSLIRAEDGEPVVTGRVSQSHKDLYNRKKATEAAFGAMLALLPADDRESAAQQFFSPPRRPQGGGVV